MEGRELAEYLQANIQMYGRAMMECLEYFENEKILTAEEKVPYTMGVAREKMKLLREVLH